MRHAVLALVLLLAAAGGLSLSGLRAEFLPVDNPAELRLRWHDPGASPWRLEERLALPIESRLSDLPGVSDFDLRILNDRLDLRLELTDAKKASRALGELYTRLSDAGLPLPSPREVELPGDSARLTWGVRSSTRSATELAQWARQQLLPAVRGLSGLGASRLEGEPTREIVVTADERRLAAVGLTRLDIVRSIQRAGTNDRADHGNALVPGGQPTSLPALAVLPVALPNGVSVPLSTLVQIRERPADAVTPPGHLELVVEVPPPAVHDARQRVESQLAWMQTNALVPADVFIVLASAPTELPASSLLLAVVGALMLAALVFAASGAGVGWRWAVAAGCAIFAGLGTLVAGQASLNVLTLTALTLALAPATSLVLLIQRSPALVSRGLAASVVVSIFVVPGLLMLSDEPPLRLWRDPLRVFVVTGLLACLAMFVLAGPRDVRTDRFRQFTAAIVDRLLRLWRLGPRAALLWVLLALGAGIGLIMLPSVNVFAPWSGHDWRLRLHGDDLEQLTQSADRLGRELSAMEGLSLSAHSPTERHWSWRVTADPVQLEEKGLDADDLERLAGLSQRGVVATVFIEGERHVPVRLEPVQRVDAGPTTDISRLIVAGELKDRPIALLREVARVEAQLEYPEIRRDRRGRYVEIGGEFKDAATAAKAYDKMVSAVDRLALPGTHEWRGMAPRVMPGLKQALVMLFTLWLLVAMLFGGWRYHRAVVLPIMLFSVLSPLPGLVLAGALQGGISVPLLTAALLSAGIGSATALVLIEFLSRAGPGVASDAVRNAFPLLLALVLPCLAVTLFWFWPNQAGFWFGRFSGGLYAGLFAILLIVPMTHVLIGASGCPRSDTEHGTK
jgi:multidrug efflux pump subunit AcrB